VGAAELRAHTSRASLWVVLSDRVYDVTAFQFDHPGGKRVLLEHAGTDATRPFVSLHSPKAYAMLERLCVGVYDAEAPTLAAAAEPAPAPAAAPGGALELEPPSRAPSTSVRALSEQLPPGDNALPSRACAHADGAETGASSSSAAFSYAESDVDAALGHALSESPAAAAPVAPPPPTQTVGGGAPAIARDQSLVGGRIGAWIDSLTQTVGPARLSAPRAAAADVSSTDEGDKTASPSDDAGSGCPHPLSTAARSSGTRCPYARELAPPPGEGEPTAPYTSPLSVDPPSSAPQTAEPARPPFRSYSEASNLGGLGGGTGTGAMAGGSGGSGGTGLLGDGRSAAVLALTGGMRTEAEASVPLWTVGARGFLPVRDPLVDLPGGERARCVHNCAMRLIACLHLCLC
jgi:hypothetical protein